MTSESDVAWIITGEERTQYDALFYSQNPVDGLLTGEKVKGLFLRSNIPAHLLSKIWRLSDVNHDNLLDVGEFAIAMHLIHYHLRGKDLPSSLPQCLVPEPQPLNNVSVMTEKEREIYRQVFEKQNKDSTGYITGRALLFMHHI
ncbi:epidermal growth factor receptor substrate 15-like [Saccoglossus kowalevskii]